MSDFTKPKILVVSETLSELHVIRDILLRDFDDVLTSLEGRAAIETFQFAVPSVLILGFSTLAESERQYLAIWRSAKEAIHLHRAVVLCKTLDVQQSYALCKRRIFDDYVQYWPMSLDPMRLAMAVHLSVQAIELEQALSVALSGLDSANEAVTARSCTVLIVDDDPFQRRAIASMIGHHGYQAIFASNGVEAMAVMEDNRPDVVLLDVVMPEMDGAETIRRMKALPHLAQIPVLMMAGDSRGTTVKATIQAGAETFLVKPIVGSILMERLERALR